MDSMAPILPSHTYWYFVTVNVYWYYVTVNEDAVYINFCACYVIHFYIVHSVENNDVKAPELHLLYTP